MTTLLAIALLYPPEFWILPDPNKAHEDCGRQRLYLQYIEAYGLEVQADLEKFKTPALRQRLAEVEKWYADQYLIGEALYHASWINWPRAKAHERWEHAFEYRRIVSLINNQK